MRSRLLTFAVVAAVFAAVPALALAATGWKSTKFLSGNGFSGKSVITRCGSKLGVYTLHGTVQIKKFGKLTEVVTVPLKGDHKAHALHLDNMGGPAFKKLSPAQRKAVFNTVAKTLDHVMITVVSVKGNTITFREVVAGKPSLRAVTLTPYSC